MSEPCTSVSDHRVEEFMRLFAQNENRIFNCILTVLPRWSEAEEVYQDCSAVLWRRFDQFQPGTDFAKWACQIAHFMVLNHRRKLRREHVYFSSEFIETIAEEQSEASDELDERRTALADCLNKLSADERELLRCRYVADKTIQTLAAETGRTAKSYYRLLDRIRQRLLECVERVGFRGT